MGDGEEERVESGTTLSGSMIQKKWKKVERPSWESERTSLGVTHSDLAVSTWE